MLADYASLTAQRRFRLPLVDISLQKSIASILGAIDDKIELNRQMGETLEAMARATFKDWFVDFGPTRAKLEGRAPYLAANIWSLFPNSLDEVGKPSGWALGSMSDLLVLQRGFDLPSQARVDGSYPIIAASGPNGFHSKYMVKGPGVTTGRSGVLGNVFFVHDNFWPLNTSLWVKEFRRATPSFAYFYLRDIDFGAYNAGSAVPTLNRNHIQGLPTPVPPRELVEAFDEMAMALLLRQNNNKLESEALAATRDFLLPRILSGEVRIRDAADLIGGAA
jgi:type I restriction enzyme, S subunit